MDHSVRWFDTLTIEDVPLVGGKNASLGEMFRRLKQEGVLVPDGFATTSEAYREFLRYNNLEDKIRALLKGKRKNIAALKKAGRAIRSLILKGRFPPDIAKALRIAYHELSSRYDVDAVDVAVRSSATAEDLPSASFAGQQETFLNIKGERALMTACLECYASLFTDRAIYYRETQKFDHLDVALSIGIQKMVRSDKAGAGVLFTLDTETGFRNVVVINASWGLGENVVQGAVTPDEYSVFKPLLHSTSHIPILGKSLGRKEKKMIYADGDKVKNIATSRIEQKKFVLSDEEILQLARWGCIIEKHYGRPMDIEWAKDGMSGAVYIVQARPETVQSQKAQDTFRTYSLKTKGTVLCQGLAIGEAIVSGTAQVIKKVSDIATFKPGNILVTQITSPDWVPIMQKASAIVTDQGGRTSHAAIVSRELGVPALIGTHNATKKVTSGQKITVSCAEGDIGSIYEGLLKFDTFEIDLKNLPKLKTQIMMNIASPAAAYQWWRLPSQGIGLARMEFIINNSIKIHPMALVQFDQLKDRAVKRTILEMTEGYPDKSVYFVERLAEGIGKIAASQYPHPVIVRMSDFKTNEYANLIGGTDFEPKEENPMLGFRGASRYYNPRYREGFNLECKAIKRVRETMGLDNVIVMIPFCRTLEEADRVLQVLGENGLARGERGLQVYMMAEIPSNVILADRFADRFDGFSIGSNDLTQLTLGIDRDSEELASLFDERNLAVKKLIQDLIRAAHAKKRKVGICGQAPSDYPEFAEFLIKEGIDSISLNPDSIVGTLLKLSGLASR
ncbi:MAG: phosphoenolpyruvate synthase [Rhabdochlamydiaceae bacterium]|nr:phosphoenolpyruvate synthase [Rhabdochlamydiaceae bacterium]